MSFNIVDLVKDQMGGQLVEQIGGALGESRGSMDNAIGGAIPAILGSLVGRSQQSGGAEALHRMLGDQDDSILDNVGNLIGGGQHAGFAEKGSGMLSSLLGGGGLGGIVGAISRFSGLGRGSAGSLIGMLAPVIMGVLKRNTGGMDAGGLASMLSGQSSNIAAAMPSGLGDALQGEGVLDSLGMNGLMGNITGGVGSAVGGVTGAVGNVAGGVGDAMGNVAGGVGDAVGNVAGSVGGAVGNVTDGVSGAVGNVAGGVGDAVGSVTDGVSDVGRATTGAVAGAAAGAAGVAGATASKGGGFLSKLLPLVILLGILFALWKFVWPMFSGGAEKAMETTTESTSEAMDAAKDTAGGAVDAAKDTAAGAVDAAKDTAAGAVDAAKDTAGGAVDAAKDTAAGAADMASDTAAGAVDAAKDATGNMADSAKEMAGDAMPNVDIGEFSTNLGGIFDGATDTLGSVTDAASAEAALPQLTEMGAKLDDMGSVFEAIPEAARGPISSLVGDKMGGLQEAADTVTALPGVGDIIKPVLEGIMGKLSAFGG